MDWDYCEGENFRDKDKIRRLIKEKLHQLEEESSQSVPSLSAPKRGNICQSFWGRHWCRNLEYFSHWLQRLPRGRSLLRKGGVYGATIQKGKIHAWVAGDDLYEVSVSVSPIPEEAIRHLTEEAVGSAFSLLDLWEGKLSDHLLEKLTCGENSLLPTPNEVKSVCQCMDWADLCEHGAALLYGAGILFEQSPELLFLLRDIDPASLIPDNTVTSPPSSFVIGEEQLEDIFDINIQTE